MKNSIRSLISARRALRASTALGSTYEGGSAAIRRSRLLHAAAARRVLERLVRNAGHLVLGADDFAQIDVLNWIVRFGQGPGTSRAVDVSLFQSGNQLALFVNVAADRL